ncbi:DUF3494 domain-containing protein [Caenimonas sedimenti]|uniref:DUF3494 domain-containing protein n=1 Tax=Caenimonas sedimenti TaxID=2596921 RepID=A0A562ZRA8_9BURK|nr:ice-binding family protein [Caenimonas sedimenti]TWO70891.1 DUF3494 domain-containing protein [Caenimonas sedimenti]
MNRYLNTRAGWPWLAALLWAATVAGCGGGSEPILGFDWAARPPTVSAVAPVNGAAGVAVNNAVISADFSEPMAPITGSASFVVSCAAPCTSPAGTVSLDATRRIGTFTLAPGTALAPLTTYTVTVTGARSAATGLPLAVPFVWRFTTGLTPDITRPRVALTVPATSSPGPTPGVPANTAVTAAFTEDMAPLSISSASFTLTCALPCISPVGTVSYVVGNRTAVFTPAVPLTPGATYTAVITSGATDLTGNALAGNQAALPAASNYIWTFTTTTPLAPAALSVASTNPSASSSNFAFCSNGTVNATFNVPSGLRMDPTTINAANFTVTEPGGTRVIASSVVLDTATGRIATFTPQGLLSPGSSYTARMRGGAGGVRDLAIPGNTMPADVSWNFVVGTCTAGGPGPGPVAPVPNPSILGTASTFGTFGGSAGTTNQGILTVINGDIGTTAVSTAVTGFHDAGPGCTYTETPLNVGTVNGLIYTAPPPPTAACPTEGTPATLAAATQALADANAAYNNLAARPPGPNAGAGNLGGLTLAPGVYTAAPAFMIVGADLTLDAQGDPNAVWVFQMPTSLTVGAPGFPRSIILSNGAQPKNVFWQVGSAATINPGGGGTMVGTVITQAGAVVSTAGALGVTTINGRLLSLGASVTLVNTVINVPPP